MVSSENVNICILIIDSLIYLYPREYKFTMGACFSKNSVSLERIEIFQFCLKKSTSVETSPPMGGEFSTDVESSNRIEMSQFILNLLNFY